MRWRHTGMGLALALAGCSALPRDTAGTTERVRTRHVIRVGYTHLVGYSPRASAFLAELEARSHARAVTREGEQEQLLTELENGVLDLVVAPFDPHTPWADRVALAPPLVDRAGEDGAIRRLPIRAAGRNGEHRWMMLVEESSRAAMIPDGR